MNLSRIRLVTFDLTNTLLKFRKSPGHQYGDISALYGVPIDDGEVLSHNFKTHWYKLSKEHPNFGLETGLGWENWWKMIVSRTFKDSKFHIDETKLNEIAEHLIEVYKTSDCWQPCYGSVDLLNYLRSKRVTMGIISNYDPRIHVTLENVKLKTYFKFVLSSYEVGCEKPGEKIFNKAVEESGLNNLEGEECLHVGDTAETDYLGAKNCGWNCALINGGDVKKKYGFVHPDHIFSSLYELHKNFVAENNNEKLIKQRL